MLDGIKVVVKIQGGLGNQLFTYAFGQAMKAKGADVYYDTKSYYSFYMPYVLDQFNVTVPLADGVLKYKKDNLFSRVLRKLRLISANPYKNFDYYLHKTNMYDPNVWNITKDTYFDGYWESEKYWLSLKEDIFQQFTLKNDFDADSQQALDKVLGCENSVAVHIRRGDKAFMQRVTDCLGLDSMAYYYNAADIIKQKVENPTFFVFSDDIPFAKKNLKIDGNVVFMDKKLNDQEEFMIMSSCKHKIIASSSYSWWAAELGEKKDSIIISPDKYAVALEVEPAPERWIKLKR